MKKWTSIFFVLLMLMQSCRVYNKTSSSIEEAVKSEKRVKIHTKDGNKLKFKKIVIDSNQFYGIKKIKGEMIKTPLDVNSIEKIRLHNKTMSIIYGTGIGLIVVFVIAGIALCCDINFDGVGDITPPQ